MGVEFLQITQDMLKIAYNFVPETPRTKPEIIFNDHNGLVVVQLTGDSDRDQPVASVITEACKINYIDPINLRLLLSGEFVRKNGSITTKGPEVDSHKRRTEYVIERKVTIGNKTYFVRDDALYPAVVDPEGDGNDFGQHVNAAEVILGTGNTPARLLIATNIQERSDNGGYTTSSRDIISVAVRKNTLIISNRPSRWVAIPPALLPKAAFNMRYMNIVKPDTEDIRARVVVVNQDYNYKDLVAAERKMPTSAPLIRIVN